MNKRLYLKIPFLLFICLYIIHPLSSQTPTASFSNWKDNKKAAYSIIHDDYSNYVTGIFQYADPIATARGIKLCFGAITNFCGATEWANARTMISHGHECVNHSHNHLCGGTAGQCSGLSTYGSAQYATELGTSTQIIEANTGIKPRFFIHPYDASSDGILSYLTGLGYLGTRAGTQEAVNSSTFTDFMHLNYFVYSPTTPLSSLNQAVDQAVASGGYAIREFHGVADGSWGAMTVVNYTGHLDYVKTQMNNGNIWSTTTTEAITYKMQRDAYQPIVSYTASTGTIAVSFNAVKTIDPSVLRTPVTLNINLNGISGNYNVTQNGTLIPSVRTGSVVTVNIYPHQGNVVLNCTDCQPTTTVSNVSNLLATPQTNAALVSWTNPTSTFSDILVVAKEGSGFTTQPTSTTYTANADFTGSSSTFEGGKVVYQGSGTNVTVTNLTAGRTYYFRVFVRNGTNWSSGVETTAVPTDVISTAPNITNLTATPQTNAASVNWANPTTTFSDILVVAKQGSGFTTKPTATSYTADANFTGNGAAFEGGKVVYQGTGTNVTVTNLTANQTYYFRVFVRNGTTWSSGIETSTVPTGSTGSSLGCLQASYFNNTTLSGTPVAVRFETAINYNWGSEAPMSGVNRDNYTVRWNGSFTAPTTGSYKFTINVDDGTRLWVNNIRLISQWSNKNVRTYTGTINLIAGVTYPIITEYKARSGNASINLSWTVPGQAIQIMPFAPNCTSLSSTRSADVVSLDGRIDNRKAVLQWVVNTQKAVDYYQLEKLDEQGEFKSLSIVNDNNQSSLRYFSFIDDKLTEGENYYRIQTIFADNTPPQYSEPLKINYLKPNNYNIFPNPAHDYVDIDLSETYGNTVSIRIFSIIGKELYQEKIESAQTAPHRINLYQFETGQYLMRIESKGKRPVTRKLVVSF
jgi:PA14 domain/Secretion system C-terminal sorting domain/Polysaccharide deacetylase